MVTYGTRSARFLALRVVKQLTVNDGDWYPIIREILNHDTYVDNILSGAFDRESAIEARKEVIELLSKGKLDARKWASNMFESISNISSSNHELALGDNDLDNLSLKVFGLSSRVLKRILLIFCEY